MVIRPNLMITPPTSKAPPPKSVATQPDLLITPPNTTATRPCFVLRLPKLIPTLSNMSATSIYWHECLTIPAGRCSKQIHLPPEYDDAPCRIMSISPTDASIAQTDATLPESEELAPTTKTYPPYRHPEKYTFLLHGEKKQTGLNQSMSFFVPS